MSPAQSVQSRNLKQMSCLRHDWNPSIIHFADDSSTPTLTDDDASRLELERYIARNEKWLCD
eukprot:8440912-Ditylum_brightwellii.AAC.1